MTTRVAPRWLLVAALLAVFLCAYPGHLDDTGLAQLRLVQRGSLSPDAPGFSVLWRLTHLVIAGPLGILLLQLGAFAYGAHGMLRRAIGDRAMAGTALLLVLPPVLVGLGVVSPTALAASLFVAAVGTEHGWVRRIALVLAVACAPVMALAAIPLFLREKLLVGALIVIAFVLGFFVTRDADQARFDLAGMHVAVTAPPFDAVEPYAQRARIVATRDAHAKANPGPYTAHRLHALAATLVNRTVPSHDRTGSAKTVALRLGVPTTDSIVQRGAGIALGVVALLMPIFGLLVAVALFLRAREHRPLIASGVISLLALVVTAGAPSHGDTLWASTAALLAGVVWLARRRA